VTDEQTNIPAQDTTNTPSANTPQDDTPQDSLPSDSASQTTSTAEPDFQFDDIPAASPPAALPEENGYDSRLERLGGEPAPAITPEEFARLQRAGQVQIDARGRVRTARRSDSEAGVSLRKRRAWYG